MTSPSHPTAPVASSLVRRGSRGRGSTSHTAVPGLGVAAAPGEQLLVGPGFDDPAGVHQKDDIGVEGRRQPVRDNQRRLPVDRLPPQEAA